MMTPAEIASEILECEGVLATSDETLLNTAKALEEDIDIIARVAAVPARLASSRPVVPSHRRLQADANGIDDGVELAVDVQTFHLEATPLFCDCLRATFPQLKRMTNATIAKRLETGPLHLSLRGALRVFRVRPMSGDELLDHVIAQTDQGHELASK